jgi:hypothetical protein
MFRKIKTKQNGLNFCAKTLYDNITATIDYQSTNHK